MRVISDAFSTQCDRGRPLRGRVAVVTGAARGVGEALARSLSDAGMRVALLGRERATLQKAADALHPSMCIEADITDREALADAACRVEAELGPASVVVANAGIAASGPFDRTPPELWQRVIDVNLTGSANTARAFLPQLTATRGYFLQIASTAAFGAAPMMSAYCASKAGAESFALALRGELEPDGIQVGIAYLHWTGTDMLTGIDDHPVLEALRRNQPRPALPAACTPPTRSRSDSPEASATAPHTSMPHHGSAGASHCAPCSPHSSPGSPGESYGATSATRCPLPSRSSAPEVAPTGTPSPLPAFFPPTADWPHR